MNIQFETTNQCNLRCIECPNRFMDRDRGDLNPRIFDVLLNDYIVPLEGNPPTIILHKDGEPLLHPNIRYFIREISKARPDVKIDLYTNGTKLDEDLFNVLATIPNKVWLLISFHFIGANGVSYKSMYDRQDGIIQQFALRGPKNVEVIFASHAHDHVDQDMLNAWKDRWEGLRSKVDNPNLSAIHINPHINPWQGLIKDSHNVHFEGCPYSDFGHLFVGVSGNVIPCCMDLNEDLVIGNVLKHSKKELFRRLQIFYGKLHHGIVENETCRKCLQK